MDDIPWLLNFIPKNIVIYDIYIYIWVYHYTMIIEFYQTTKTHKSRDWTPHQVVIFNKMTTGLPNCASAPLTSALPAAPAAWWRSSFAWQKQEMGEGGEVKVKVIWWRWWWWWNHTFQLLTIVSIIRDYPTQVSQGTRESSRSFWKIRSLNWMGVDGLDPFRGLLSLGLDFMALSLEDFQFCSGLRSWDPFWGFRDGPPKFCLAPENPHPKTY